MSSGRRRAAWVLLLVGLPALMALLVPARDDLNVGTELLLVLTLAVGVGALGGLGVGLVAAVAGAVAANYYFVPPYGTLDVHNAEDAVALAVFLAVGATVSALVDRVASGSAEAASARADAEAVAAADALRAAILRSVSHDLRTPLAAIKASVTSLTTADVEFGPDDTAAFLATIDEQVDRLDHVVGNLLDMSRLQAGVLHVATRPTALEEVVVAAVRGVEGERGRVRIDVPATLPLVLVDPALVERAVANVVANALEVQPPGRPIVVCAEPAGDRVRLSVVDDGPGIPAQDRAAAIAPFQRLDDRSSQVGAGLGLAIADGFATAVGGDMALRSTPGGGLTVVFHFPATRTPAPPASELPDVATAT